MSNTTDFPKTTASFIYHFAKKQWFKFFIFIITSMVWAVSDVVFPYFLKQIVNTLQYYHGTHIGVYAAVQGTLILLVLFWVMSDILLRVQGFLQLYTFPQFRANIRESVFNYVKLHSHEYFSRHFSGNIAKKMADLPNSAQGIMEIVCFQFITSATGAVLVLIMMWSVKPIFAIILLVWLIIHFAISTLFVKFGNPLWKVHADAVSMLSGKIVDVFTNILNVRLFARGRYELNYLKKYQDEEIQKAKKAIFWTEVMRIFLGLNGLFLIFAMIFTLLYGWSYGWVTLGDFTQVGMQAFWLLGWVWFVSYQMTVFARETGTVAAALSLVSQGHGVVDKKNAQPLVVKNGEIVFDKVCFGYDKNDLLFQNLDVYIPGGQKVGLVGFSGSGKSTFVNLILRFYDIQSGRILIDQQNISNVTQDSLRSQISMIPQDPILFHRSLMENIRYGYLNVDEKDVIRASKLAHCHNFIKKLDHKYDTLVGERGIKLSGGQRQRIAIARAILKNAPILILDEATSALDSVTEKLIQESLEHLMKDKTTLVVAHRLSTLANMDRILVFSEGKIIEEGTQESLLAQEGHFAMLWSMQNDGFLPDAK